MLYIISEKKDIVTDLVEEWLIHHNTSYKRINVEEMMKLTFSFDNDYLLNDVSLVWHRRGKFNFLPIELFTKYANKTSILNYIKKETNKAEIFVETFLKKKLNKKYIGSFIDEKMNNKLLNLLTAKECGFNVPDTIVTTNKEDLLSFKKKHHSIISKDLDSPVNIKTLKKRYVSRGVELVDDSIVDKLNDFFMPIFLQKYVQKKFEIRIFVFLEKLYSMAIFSQNDEKTRIDFRNYNNKKPNRTVPFKLPLDIKDKVKTFMKISKLNTGSIDLIVTPKNKYVFLEINPMGQFHWLSANCNFLIERDIAKHLSNG